ncbi:MAG TPA: glucoamylase family protein, partial [Bryobacteraceae bacterium]|nr:glucoamylase family protein [Bryobacteraceae bacterium]
MGEIWALKPTLQLILLERLAAAEPASWPVLVSSLRSIDESTWRELFEAVNTVDRVLQRDPAGAYAAMDYESRNLYRKVLEQLAARSTYTESEVAEAAVALAREASESGLGDPFARRRSHVGFYLLDRGLAPLRNVIGWRPRVRDRLRDGIYRNATFFYLVSIELLTFLTVVGLLSGLSVLTPIAAGFLLLLLPATQAAVDFMNNLVASIVAPRTLPKLDLSKGIPADCVTMVAVPTLLLNETQVRDLVLDLEIRFLANRDPNLYFALLTDTPDSDQRVDEHDTLVAVCRELIEALNRRYGTEGHSPFHMFHRHRAFNPSEGRWMGWERKRGKLLDLNRLLRGGYDSFPVKAGDLSVLPRVKYVITLDSDTQLPRDSAARLIGAIAHPLNRAVVNRATRMVVEGYGILQPRIGISIQSASRSRLAAIYSGQTGFDIYTHAISDVYQDLFGEGIFTGKGIYDVDALREVLEQRFPENALLSHDLIEGAYARVALVSDIELIDDYPSHFSAYSRRKHRWVRGDWQIMRWLLARVPDLHGHTIPNPISLISRWKILDNLRRSVLEPSILFLLVGGWLYLPGRPWYWTLATLAVLFLPVYSNLLFSFVRAPWGRRTFVPWLRDTGTAFAQGHWRALLSLVFLLHQALLSLDAIVRSVLRVFITKRKLLEWETAAEAETAQRPRSTVDAYLEWTPWFSAALAATVWLLRPAALPVALPIIALWFASRGISAWLNGAPRVSNRALSEEDSQRLREWAEQMCRFFRDWSTEATQWLIPDSVHEDGQVALRLSPTNLGMLLNARIAAVHLGVLPLSQFVIETQATLDRMASLEKYRGHPLNWYDIQTLKPLEPRFVSTVDSGNLAAALWTLKQAAIAFAAAPTAKRGPTAGILVALESIAETCDRLVRDMDFGFLYLRRRKVLSVGYDIGAGRLEPSAYDLLASEARIASFIAIAKGDIPQEAWFHLGRAHTLYRGERALLSWTGTMFEYLMPSLWMHHFPGTIGNETMQAVVRIQREYARRKGTPWGISESACLGEDGGDCGYGPFGIPELAMKHVESERLVVAPYATFLALAVAPAEAMNNLRAMEEFGWCGRYGFYEAIDYSRSGAEVIRSWMAHHQGMSLLAVCNLLHDNPMSRHFHAEPQVLATELLLQERVPSAIAAQTTFEALPSSGAA